MFNKFYQIVDPGGNYIKINFLKNDIYIKENRYSDKKNHNRTRLQGVYTKIID